MNTSAFMHFFARRSYTHAKVLGASKEFSHVSTGRANAVIIAIDGFEVLGHMLIDLSFKVLNCARGATIKVIVNLDGDFFHAFKVALKFREGQAIEHTAESDSSESVRKHSWFFISFSFPCTVIPHMSCDLGYLDLSDCRNLG